MRIQRHQLRWPERLLQITYVRNYSRFQTQEQTVLGEGLNCTSRLLGFHSDHGACGREQQKRQLFEDQPCNRRSGRVGGWRRAVGHSRSASAAEGPVVPQQEQKRKGDDLWLAE